MENEVFIRCKVGAFISAVSVSMSFEHGVVKSKPNRSRNAALQFNTKALCAVRQQL